MHQTFYIDIDEEITSIVERLRNAGRGEVVIVVPKRALLIQSIVNLRLLKKEADSLGVSLSIVTQDNLGKVLIEKAGISYQERLDEVGNEDVLDSRSRISDSNFGVGEQKTIEAGFFDQSGKRAEKIGSDNYFNASAGAKEEKITNAKISRDTGNIPQNANVNQGHEIGNEKILNKELVSGVSEDIKTRKGYASIDSGFSSPASSLSQEGRYPEKKESFPPNFNNYDANRPSGNQRSDFYRPASGDRKIDNFFQHPNIADPISEKKSDFKNTNLSKKARKVFFAFCIVFLLLVVFTAAYLFLPKATVLIVASGTERSQEAEIKVDIKAESLDYENETIPAKLVSETVEVSKTVGSSGNKAASSKKARGTITIYNEFSSAPQPLVATTRFQSEEGKIFRLEKGISVPGTSKEGSETKPGTIDVEVVADEAGENYNIGASKFSIPGFKDNGNDKYTKIYAKSTKTMSGGGSSDSASSGNNTITEADINSAKSQVLADLNVEVKNKMKSSAGEGMAVLDDAINMGEATYSLSNSAGEVAEKFEIKAQVKAEAIVFSEADLKNVLGKIIAKSGNGKISIDGESVSLLYGKSDADFKAGTVTIKVRGTSSDKPDIDLENLKKGILGKSNEELEVYLGTYQDISKVDVTYWPPFMNKKIPIYEKRVEVTIEPAGIDK